MCLVHRRGGEGGKKVRCVAVIVAVLSNLVSAAVTKYKQSPGFVREAWAFFFGCCFCQGLDAQHKGVLEASWRLSQLCFWGMFLQYLKIFSQLLSAVFKYLLLS